MRCSCLENGKYLTILFIQTNLYDLNNTKKIFSSTYNDVCYNDHWWYWEDQSDAGKGHQLLL